MTSRPVYGWGLALVMTLWAACQPAPPTASWRVNGLDPGGRTFQKLAPGEVHSVYLQLPQASYLSATLEPVGCDLALTLRGPRGRELAHIGGRAGAGAVQFLAARTNTGGPHRLEVRSPSGAAGSYALGLSELRELREGDEERVEGWRGLQVGHHALFRGRQELALQSFATALEHFERYPDPIGEAYALQQLGWIEGNREGPQAALKRYDEALVRLADTDAPGVRAGLLADRASALMDTQDLRKARDQYEQALDLWRRAGDERNRIETLNSLGKLLLALGETEEAESLLIEVLEHRRLQGDPVGEANTWSILGTMYKAKGNYSRALKAHQTALEIARQEKRRELEFNFLVNVGAVLRLLAEPQGALQKFDQALELEPEVRDPSMKRLLMSHLGLAHVEIGDPDAAVPFFERALGLAVIPEDKARTLLSWGWAEDDRGRQEVALELYGRALLLQPSMVPDDVRTRLHIGRARALRRSGRLAEARAAIEEAGAVASKSQPKNPIDLWLESGEIARLQGRREEARKDLERALETSRQWGLAALEAVALVRLGQLARDEGHLGDAREQLERGLGIYESLRSQVTSFELRTYYLSQRMTGYEAYLDLLVELARRQSEESWLYAAFKVSEQMRAKSLEEKLSATSAGTLSPPLLERKRHAVENLQRVQRLLLETGDPSYRGELERWKQELERIQWQVRSESARSVPGGSEEITAERVGSLLPTGTVLLEYAPGVHRSFLFAVTRDGLELRILPPTREIDALVRDLAESFRTPSRRLRGRRQQLSEALYRLLVEPAEVLLEDAQHVLVVPTGLLHYLPFEALWTGEDYLVSRWTVTYAPSAAVLQRLRRRATPKVPGPSFLAFADPELIVLARVESTERDEITNVVRGGLFSAVQRGEFRRLPGARREVQTIAAIFDESEVRVHVGSEATEKRLKTHSEVRGARWIHIASHGILDGRDGFSSLLLAQAADSPEDGLLQVHEIRDLELTADLVVLSACETGLGAVVRGEGLVGFSRAFLSAGARNLLVSLWRVEDQSTADLMVAFYRRLLQGEPPAQALREAKLQLIAEERWLEPYYWAPFVLIGGH